MNIINSKILLNLKNIPGWSVPSKIVVFECDDWGSLRMPSGLVYNKMLESGMPVDKSRYTRFDTLADKDDLYALFEVLLNYKDVNQKPAVFTPVCNVANPDFDKIKASNFKEYANEPFTTTLERYNRHPETFKLWLQGIAEGIFIPQSHGREHLTVQLWMRKLQEGNKWVHLGFEYGFCSVEAIGIPGPARQFRPEFFVQKMEDIGFLRESIPDGISLFEKIFGFKPVAFVPSNDIFHPILEPALSNTGVQFLYTGHRSIVYNPDGTQYSKRHIFGERSTSGLIYYMRNCAFEPTDFAYKGIGLTLNQIEAAFRWKKPAIISTHRVNFVGGIDPQNRKRGLDELKLLLNAIVKRWPDVVFMSTADLFASFKNAGKY